jgi:hypothetical protein
VHTTNYTNAFIAVAEDCPVAVGTAPPEREPPTVAHMQYEMLEEAPYRFTSDEVVFGVHAAQARVPAADMDAARAAFFAKGQPCLRSSPLAQAYGWGFHFDADGRVAMVGLGTDHYETLAADGSLEQRRAMRRSRAR